jgi:hypothetical protein
LLKTMGVRYGFFLAVSNAHLIRFVKTILI